MRQLFQSLIILSVFTILAGKCLAQNKDGKWKYTLQPYIMFPNLNGTVGLSDLPDADVKANPGDVFSHLKIGAMLYFEAYNDKWAFSSDVLYMNLKKNVEGNKLVNYGEATSKQLAWEVAGMRKVIPWLELGAGLRLNSLNAGLNINVNSGVGGQTTNKVYSGTKTWVDPILVTRIKIPSKGRLSAQLRTDIGGFGIGSKFCWQAQLDGNYRVSKLLDIGLGYRFIGVNYDKGSGTERFLYNVDTFGPAIKFRFNL